MATARRMGPKGSEIWLSMLDAAEQILSEEGYGALTSRSIAERIGVKQRLVYYYFQSMDELIVETFRRLAEREEARFVHALKADRPLHEIWEICVNTTDTRLVSEFMALANRIEPLRREVRNYIEKSRAMQVAALDDAMKRNGGQDDPPAVALAIFATNAALALHREAEIGITSGHREVRDAIAGVLSRLDRQD